MFRAVESENPAGQGEVSGNKTKSFDKPIIAQKPVKILSNSGRVIGEVSEDTFRKTVRGSKHMLQSPRGWALDVEVLQAAAEAGASRVLIVDGETGTEYRAPLSAFYSNQAVAIDRGFGLQKVLKLRGWQVKQPGVPEQLPFLELLGSAV